MFSVQFLLKRDVNQDTVSNYSKIIFWWLALVFNISNNLLKERYAELGKFILPKKNRKE